MRASTNNSNSLRSDVNGDGFVDVFDISILAIAYGSYSGHQRWDQRVDLNDDGVVDMIDLVLLAMDLETAVRGATADTESETPRSAEFLSGFHTGASLWHAYDKSDSAEWEAWAPAREAKIITFGMANQRSGTIQTDGSVTGSWTDAKIQQVIQKWFQLNIVPVLVFSQLNMKELTESHVRNFFLKLEAWINAVDPNKFVVWQIGSECNFPDGMAGWRSRKIDYRIYNPQMRMIRSVRDNLGLQDKVLLGCHGNLLKSYRVDAQSRWISQDWLTEFVGIDEYIDGFAQNDIIGFSQYYAYKDSSRNPGDLTWRETLQKSWARSKIIWEKICASAGKTLPFMFMEYSLGNPWRSYGTPIWKEGVTYTYTQMVHNNKWVKGLNWYVGSEIEPDAMQELVRLAEQYNGYN